MSGALGRRAEEEYQSLDDADQVAARELFTRLVTPGEGAADTRRRARRSELLALPVGAEAMERVINGFGEQRLLTFDRDPATREPTVEVGHEALLTEWPRLKAWVDEDREGLRLVRRVGEASEAWAHAGREEADLLRGARLEAVTEWTTANPGRLSADEGEFVAASIAARDAARARERRNTRRLHRLVVGVSAALVLALIAGAIAVAQRNESTAQRNRAREQTALAEKNAALAQKNEAAAKEAARNAEIDKMAAQAGALAESNNPQALLLALEADRLRPDVNTLGALEVALLARPELLDTVSMGAKLVHVVPSVDGKTISGGTYDGRAVRIDVDTGRVVDEWKVSDGIVVGTLDEQGEGLAEKFGGSELLVKDPDGSVRTLVKDGLVSAVVGVVLFGGAPERPKRSRSRRARASESSTARPARPCARLPAMPPAGSRSVSTGHASPSRATKRRGR